MSTAHLMLGLGVLGSAPFLLMMTSSYVKIVVVVSWYATPSACTGAAAMVMNARLS